MENHLAFVRGASNPVVPFASAQIYIKVLPLVEQPVMITGNVSPDGRWITGWSGVEATGWQAFPLHGGAPRVLGNTRNATAWQWSARRSGPCKESGDEVPG
jgi:hypothetical protein